MNYDQDIEKFLNLNSLETAYFQLRCNVLRNNKKQTDYYLGLINNILSIKPELISQMDLYYVNELDKIKKVIASDTIPFSWSDPIPFNSPMSQVFSNKSFQYSMEKDLRNKLFYDNFNLINEVCDLDLKPIGIEIKSNHGFIDILGKQNDQIWIIELKRNQGNFKIVSQIAKYILAYEEKLINRTFRSVHSIAIANGFSKYSLQSLKKMGTITIHYEKINDNLTLKKV